MGWENRGENRSAFWYMKIAQLISLYIPDGVGGAQICVHNIARQLVAYGHEVIVITPQRKIKCGFLGYEVIEIPKILMKFLSHRLPFSKQIFVSYLAGLQRRHKFDIWQVTMGYPFGVFAVDFFKEYDIPCVLRCSGEDIQKDYNVSYGYRIDSKIDCVIRESYPKFDAVVAISKTMSDEYHALQIPDEKIHLIPNGVDYRRFQSIQRSGALHQRYGIIGDKKIILTVGRLHPKKGYDLIPKIIGQLLQKRDDFVWLVIGRGSGAIRALASIRKIGEHLITEEEICVDNDSDDATSIPSSRLIGYYKNADIFVFPSYIETFGIVLMEAMAAGIPVVTTDAHGCRDVVTHEKTGLIAPVGHVQRIADHISRVFDDSHLRQSLIKEGLRTAYAHDWDIVAQKYARLYESLVL